MSKFFASIIFVPVALVFAACTPASTSGGRSEFPVASAPRVASEVSQGPTLVVARVPAPTILTGSYRQSDGAVRWMQENGNRGPHSVVFSPDGATVTVSSFEAPDFTLERQGGPESRVFVGNYPARDERPLLTTFTFTRERAGDAVLSAEMVYGPTGRPRRSSFFKEAE